MSVAEAERYHSEQIRVFAETEADMITAITMNYVEEAIGIVRAAGSASACPSRSPSRWRPTAACRPARR